LKICGAFGCDSVNWTMGLNKYSSIGGVDCFGFGLEKPFHKLHSAFLEAIRLYKLSSMAVLPIFEFLKQYPDWIKVIMPHFKEISNPNMVHRLKRAVVWRSQRINSNPLLNSEIRFRSCAKTFKECRSLLLIGLIVKLIVEITILKHLRMS
jgi:hypothetical protein